MSDYRNRITGLEYVSSNDLTPHPGNWRDHPKGQVEALRGVLSEVGIAGALLAYRSERNGGKLTVIDGHLRKDAAPQSWPVLILDVDDAEADYILATHDPLAAMAQADAAALDALLETVNSGEAAVQGMLAELAKEAGLYVDNGGSDVEPQIDKAEELRVKWGVESGQMWQLGDHRLICGDCTDAAVVDAVAFGNQIDLWVSDPPYGVSYAEKNRYLNAVAKGNRIQVPIEGDHNTVGEMSDLWRNAFAIVSDIAKPGCVYYINAPQGGELMMMMMMLYEVGWLLKPQIIWVKNNHVLGRSDYQLKHEPILYGWKDGGAHFWCGERSEMSVWNVDKPQKSDLHPTTKPVELIEKAVKNSSREGEVVFDGFLGSGTTLIACENLGRKCRAVEISPAYVAVALQRWADATGKIPVLLESS